MNQPDLRPTEIDLLKHRTFYGREKDNTLYPIALANLVLYGLDDPHRWHGNTFTSQESYANLLKAVNPNVTLEEDGRTPEGLIAFIEAKGREVAAALARLRGK